VTHFGVQEVLVDRRQLLFEGEIELSNDLSVPTHSAASFARASAARTAVIVCRKPPGAQSPVPAARRQDVLQYWLINDP
jgi:hypothetical protein